MEDITLGTLCPEEAWLIALYRAMNVSKQFHFFKLMEDFSNGKISLEELSEILNKRD